MASKKTIEQRRVEAEKLVERISGLLQTAQEQVKEVTEELKEAAKAKREFQGLKPSMTRLLAQAKAAIEQTKNDRASLTAAFRKVDRFISGKYDPLVLKVLNSDTGLEAQYKQSDKLRKEIEVLKTGAQDQLAIIEKYAQTCDEKTKELELIANAIVLLKQSIEEHSSSVGEKHAAVEVAFNKVEAATKAILDSEQTIKAKEAEFGALYTKCEKDHERITAWHNEAEETLEKIKEIYQIAAMTGMGGEFDKRRKALDDQRANWRRHVFGSSLLLLVMIIALFILQLASAPDQWKLSSLTFDSNFYVRFLITSPVIFYLILATRQFEKNKNMMERYAFKTTLALSIEAHMNLLLNNKHVQEHDKSGKAVDFIIDGFQIIYREPFPVQQSKSDGGLTKEVLDTLRQVRSVMDTSH